ncbi:MAG: phytoene desaturase [Thermoplasmata archaeon]|nr:MAG: phytoene desaturase [Thermoplasmata archaeon]
MQENKAIVVGSGFGGMAAASILAKNGYAVTVLEKNDMPGGRAQVWKKDGYIFDMGPSWYLMPDVFERYFALFGKKPEDFLKLERLDPHYRVFYSGGKILDISAVLDENMKLFDELEKDGAKKLREYLDNSKYQYEIAMEKFLYKDYKYLTDFFNWKLIIDGSKFHVFSKLDSYVSRYFESPEIKKILEYNIVFLGGAPKNSPALYSLMTHVDFNLGVWYPKGGLGQLVNAFYELAQSQGVEFIFNHEVTRIKVENDRAVAAVTDPVEFQADVFVMNADHAYVDLNLLDRKHRSYSEKYWDQRKIAPSAILMFLGFNKRLPNLKHHNLYLLDDWDVHFETLFNKPGWPDEPCIYICCPSKTDSSVAPEGHENIFILVPVASDLDDTDVIREKYFKWVIDLLQRLTGEAVTKNLVVKRIFSHRDFKSNYNAYKGTALGLAHTLRQTAVFRPQHQNKKLRNLFYTGHYNHPGIGVPMVTISSQIVADVIKREM